MALPDYFTREIGTAITWSDGGTNDIDLNGLAANTAVQGVAVDLGVVWQEEYYVQLVIEPTSAPTAGTRVDLYLASAYANSSSYWPGGVSGSGGSHSTSAGKLEQLGWPITSLVASNESAILKQQPVLWRPRGRYVVPVVHNLMNVAVISSNNDSRVHLIPVRAVIQDS